MINRQKKLTTICSLLIMCALVARAQWPWAGPEYLSYSSNDEKTVIVQPDGTSYRDTIYSYGSVDSTGSTSRLTRYNRNGQITTLNHLWIQTRDNYAATPYFQSPRQDGSTYTYYTRKSSRFSCDYFVPSNFNGTITVTLDLVLNNVDNRGNIIGSTSNSTDKKNIGPDSSGRINLSPQSGTSTVSAAGWGLYYLNN